jgi:glycosyltransferase involved in cell wall biosynthesis
MDVFVFPLRTDTFGTVVLEAFASGTPAVVTAAGRPRFIVKDGVAGFSARADGHSSSGPPACLATGNYAPGRAARSAAAESWDAVFDKVYEG